MRYGQSYAGEVATAQLLLPVATVLWGPEGVTWFAAMAVAQDVLGSSSSATHRGLPLTECEVQPSPPTHLPVNPHIFPMK